QRCSSAACLCLAPRNQPAPKLFPYTTLFRSWQPLTINTAGQQTPAASFPITYNDGQPFTVGADVQIRFVRRLNEPLPAAVTIFDPMYLRHMQTDGATISVGAGTYRIAQVRPNTVTLVSGGTCTTPSVSVTL